MAIQLCILNADIFLFRVCSERRNKREEMKNIIDLVEMKTGVISHELDCINNLRVLE